MFAINTNTRVIRIKHVNNRYIRIDYINNRIMKNRVANTA